MFNQFHIAIACRSFNLCNNERDGRRSFRRKQRVPVSHIDGHEHRARTAAFPALLADGRRQVFRRRDPGPQQQDDAARGAGRTHTRCAGPDRRNRVRVHQRHEFHQQAHAVFGLAKQTLLRLRPDRDVEAGRGERLGRADHLVDRVADPRHRRAADEIHSRGRSRRRRRRRVYRRRGRCRARRFWRGRGRAWRRGRARRTRTRERPGRTWRAARDPIRIRYASVRSAAIAAAMSWNSLPRCWTLSGWYRAISRRNAFLISSAGAVRRQPTSMS